MDSHPSERGAKPKSNRSKQQSQRIVRKLPPRATNDKRNNIYITSKSDFKVSNAFRRKHNPLITLIGA